MGVHVSALVRRGIARSKHPPGGTGVCVKDRVKERVAIKACRNESTTLAGNNACWSTARVSATGDRVLVCMAHRAPHAQ